MHYEQRVIDLLTIIANRTTGDIYVTFNNKKGWSIASQPDENNAQVDRNNIKASITAIVDRLAPKPELV
jgi:hypothetical protein